ncbi:phage head-binding domain-containing protein [Vibrio fluvialis]|uniref:phage tailspike protein n=1 Tax=Vibrio fluvialis TaxID=676 RepID=UPI001F45D52F|nr:phage tailspike protein [Vibrio fluvialis]MCE7614190.1 phage head-binding domain-containing protein [Vibrio fluvialis]
MTYPNTVISMPSQLFTMRSSFKAVANGKIYIGEPDTDPTIESNQIQVYSEQENGDLVPVSQPISISSAGFPVDSMGNVAKFVANQAHSMVVNDAYGAQQFYFPDVYKFNPIAPFLSSIKLVFDSISDMLSFDAHGEGNKVSTGATTWKILPASATRGLPTANGTKAIPLNGLWGKDAGVTYDGVGITDDTVAMNQLYQYGKDLEESFAGPDVATGTKPVIRHSSGVCWLTGTVATGGNLISRGERTMFAGNGAFPLFTTSNYNTEWSGMQFDNPLGQWIVSTNTTRIESSKCHIHDCDFYRAAPDKHGLETDTSVHYNYPMIFVIDNVKSYGSAFARLHTNGVYISNSWIAWDTDYVTVDCIECSDPLVLTNVLEVPYGSNPNKLARISSPSGRSLQLTCKEVRFGGEATQTPIVRTKTADGYEATLDFDGCAMFGVANFYWAEFDGHLPRRISVKNCKGSDKGGFVNCLGMRVATTTDPVNYKFACLSDFGDDVPAVARRLIQTDDRTSGSVPTLAVPADFMFSKPKENTALKLINEDTGNGFSFFGAPYTAVGNASFVGSVNFMGYSFPQWRFENPNENIRVNSPTISPGQGKGIYTCAVYVIAENGGGTVNAGYKFDSSEDIIETKSDLIELGLNRITWQVYYDEVTPIQVYFNVGSTASQGNTTMLLGGLTVNKGDIVGDFVPWHTGAVSGILEVSFGAAPPADGRFKTGHYRYNTDIASTLDGNGFYLKGWVCSSGGTPGTWQADWARNAKWPV